MGSRGYSDISTAGSSNRARAGRALSNRGGGGVSSSRLKLSLTPREKVPQNGMRGFVRAELIALLKPPETRAAAMRMLHPKEKTSVGAVARGLVNRHQVTAGSPDFVRGVLEKLISEGQIRIRFPKPKKPKGKPRKRIVRRRRI